jgi:uncharacterized membrane protein YqjE
MATRVPIDPDKGISDLFRQLGDDSKRLLGDEVRLAKLETGESVHRAGQGAIKLGIAFGIAVVGLVAATLFLVTIIGAMANGHYWLGALLTAVFEITAGMWLLRRGMRLYKDSPYSLPDTRAGLRVIRNP